MTAITQIENAITSPEAKAIEAETHIDKRTGKPKRLSRSVIKAIRLITSGECKTIKAAAERVNMNANHLSTVLGKPHVQAFIVRESSKKLGTGVARASARMIDLIDSSSEHVSFNAADRVLAQAGLKPQHDSQPTVNINITPGYVIDLSGRRPDGTHARVIDHHQQSEPKPLIGNDTPPS